MNAEQQAAGEKRVSAILFEALEDLGLGRPTTTTKAGFERMKRTVCQTLAAMGEGELIELQAWIKRHPTGPNKDRFPIGVRILEEAQKVAPEQGDGSPSPLFRAVFASPLGREAIQKGWAPELLDWLQALPMGERKWPRNYTLSLIKQKADDPRRRLEDIELYMSRDDPVSAEDRVFRDHRVAAIRRCQDIAELDKEGQGG